MLSGFPVAREALQIDIALDRCKLWPIANLEVKVRFDRIGDLVEAGTGAVGSRNAIRSMGLGKAPQFCGRITTPDRDGQLQQTFVDEDDALEADLPVLEQRVIPDPKRRSFGMAQESGVLGAEGIPVDPDNWFHGLALARVRAIAVPASALAGLVAKFGLGKELIGELVVAAVKGTAIAAGAILTIAIAVVALQVLAVKPVGLGAEGAGYPLPREVIAGGVAIE